MNKTFGHLFDFIALALKLKPYRVKQEGFSFLA